MAPGFDEPAVIHDVDDVCVAYVGESMSDQDRGGLALPIPDGLE
jgi:hypothetical protein